MNLDTLIPAAEWRRFIGNEALLLVVYLRLMIVSITLTSKVPEVLDVLDVDVLDVLDVAGVGAGSALPVVGISPASIDVDSAHISTTAVASFFIVVSAPVGP